MNFIVNKKNTPEGLLLIVTDKELVGKKFEEGKKQLDLTNKFYEGVEKTTGEVKLLVKGAYILHLTGKEAVNLGKKLGLVEKVISVDDVEHAEVLIDDSETS